MHTGFIKQAQQRRQQQNALINSAENTISVFNTTTALSPGFIQKFQLKNSGPLYPGPMPGTMFTTSEDFHLALSTSERILFVLRQLTTVDFSIGSYNYLHVLAIAPDGSLTEPGQPVLEGLLKFLRKEKGYAAPLFVKMAAA